MRNINPNLIPQAPRSTQNYPEPSPKKFAHRSRWTKMSQHVTINDNAPSRSASRRSFIRSTALAVASLSLLRNARGQNEAANTPAGPLPRFHIFSKHLHFLDYTAMSETAARIGFDGVDLTVRPEGHVLPENAARDLPLAVAAIRAAGLSAEMMTTAIDDASDHVDLGVLRAAADCGLLHYRMNWLSYAGETTQPEQLAAGAQRLAQLASVNRELGLVGCYQNHAGKLIGASLWEVWQLLQSAEPAHFGVQYDIRHATVEGALSWPNGLSLVLPRIKTIVLKDFKWIYAEGRNQIVNTPLGEGAVDFKSYFRFLKANAVNVPVSLHLEYDLGGAQWGQRQLTIPQEAVFEAMAKDLATAKRLWTEA